MTRKSDVQFNTRSASDWSPEQPRGWPGPRFGRAESQALWVGNIPPDTDILTLKVYFCNAASTDLLSISYNPDARYAFVNFATKDSRIAAIEFSASNLFEGRRLDCRIRQTPTGRSIKINYGLYDKGSRSRITIDQTPNELRNKVLELAHFPECDRDQWGKHKFFIIKSFSLEAMYQSLETNRWFIPNRHIFRVNSAFQTANKVYFLFSVNGSGEFFGYATMTSEIEAATDVLDSSDYPPGSPVLLNEDASNIIFKEGNTNSPIRSRTTSTASRNSLNQGIVRYQPERRRIIWENAQGPLDPKFEEATSSSPLSRSFSMTSSTFEEPEALQRSKSTTKLLRATLSNRKARPPFYAALEQSHQGHPFELQNISSPCQIKWVSTEALLFEDAQVIRNPWNDNKEICIARNMTPVEPEAGLELLELWREKAKLRQNERLRDASARAWGLC